MMAWRGGSAVVILLSITPVSASVYDPNYCYILDAILLLYGVIITAFFVRERCLKKRSVGDQDSLYQPINKSAQSAYDVLGARGAEEGPARGGRKRGGDDTYTVRALHHRKEVHYSAERKNPAEETTETPSDQKQLRTKGLQFGSQTTSRHPFPKKR